MKAEDYIIAVRSYKRYESIKENTLRILDEQDLLDRVQLVVASEDEASKYRESFAGSQFSDIPMVVTEKGGGMANSHFCEHKIPQGQPLVFMDDDIEDIHLYTDITDRYSKKVPDSLGDIFVYALNMLKETGSGMFSIVPAQNPYWRRHLPFAQAGIQGKIAGWLWGGWNNEAFVTYQNHSEDCVRSVQVWEKFGRTLRFNWIEGSMGQYGLNEGGMQADGSRKDTKAEVETLLKERPIMKKYFYDKAVQLKPKYLPEGHPPMYHLKAKTVTHFKKLPNWQPPIEIKEFMGEAPEIKNPKSLFNVL